MKELIIVGGPNGSGKTTFAKAYAKLHGYPYLGADEIAERLSPGAPEKASVQASRQFIQLSREAQDTADQLIIESTLSGRMLTRFIADAKLKAFEITLFFLFLNAPEPCVARVRERVLKGGHHVPEEDVKRRYFRAINNFWHLYRPLANHWTLINNAGNSPHNIATGNPDDMIIHDNDMFQLFKQQFTQPS